MVDKPNRQLHVARIYLCQLIWICASHRIGLNHLSNRTGITAFWLPPNPTGAASLTHVCHLHWVEIHYHQSLHAEKLVFLAHAKGNPCLYRFPPIRLMTIWYAANQLETCQVPRWSLSLWHHTTVTPESRHAQPMWCSKKNNQPFPSYE